MKYTEEELQKRIDFFRNSGRPVPYLLEARLYRMRTKKKVKPPVLVRKGFLGNKQ